MTFVVEAFDGRLLDGAVHPFDLAIRPRVVGLGEAMLDVVCTADHVEAHRTREDRVSVARLLGELDAVVRQDSVDVVGHCFQEVFQELPRCSSIGFVDELGDRELAGAVDADEQVELAFGSLHLGDIDVEEADGIALEALALRLVAFDVWQTGNAMPLQASMQCRPGEMRDRRLQRIEAVIQR